MAENTKGYPSTEELDVLSRDIRNTEQKLRDALQIRYSQIKKKTEEMPFSKVLGIQCIELKQGYAHLEMPVVYETHANWNKYVCGGATSAVIDIALGAAVETLVDYDQEMIATLHLNVDFISPAELGKTMRVIASWNELEEKQINGELPLIRVPSGNKKLVQVDARAIQLPELKEVARGNAWYVVFGKKIQAQD